MQAIRRGGTRRCLPLFPAPPFPAQMHPAEWVRYGTTRLPLLVNDLRYAA